VIWKNVKQKFWSVTRGEPGQETDRAVTSAIDPDLSAARLDPRDDVDSDSAHAHSHSSEPYAAGRTRAPPDGSCSDRVRSWRRRVLSKRGARMYSGMVANAPTCSLAMLDAMGVVVSWHDHADDGGDQTADSVVNRHVSQFYTTQDIASGIPQRDLRVAAANGNSTQQGWRLRPDGAVFWGVTTIDAMVLRDGRLQGYSYVTSKCQGPHEQALAVDSRAQQQTGANASLPLIEDKAHWHAAPAFHHTTTSLWVWPARAAIASVSCDQRGTLR
jgi:hypothetical protein